MPVRVEKDEIARTARLFLANQKVREVRALDVSTPEYRYPHIEAGYFADPELLVKDVMRLSQHAAGIYITLNPVNPALLARSANRLKAIRTRDPLTSDRDILERQWILLDFDPVRPAGISSTDTEHELSLEVALAVRLHLSQLGFPQPVLADSGNGTHLLYQTHLDANEGEVTKDFLQTLASRFDTELVKIDTGVYNAARITKLYGTVARKGDDTVERPHRASKILEIPENLQPVSLDALQYVLLEAGRQSQKPMVIPTIPSSPEGDIRSWCQEHGLVFREPKILEGGGVLYALDVCPFNPDHRGGSAYVIQFPNGGRHFGCQHTSCQDKDWHALRVLLEPGWQDRKQRASKQTRDSAEAPGDNLPRTCEESSKPNSHATQIVDLMLSNATLFHSPGGQPHAALLVNGHQEVYSLRSRSVREWCSRQFWLTRGVVPGSQALQDALNILSAIAVIEGKSLPVYTRLGGLNNSLYLDLGNETWQAIEVDRFGWRVVDCPPVMFRRPGTLGKLPNPQTGGQPGDLLRFFNLVSANQGRLLMAFLLGVFQLDGPFPLLNLNGEQGTAKTTSARLLKALVDPATPLIRSAPRTEHDLMLAAQSNYILAFDNVSRLQPWMSDALCRLSTGGGIGVRRLYSDDEEMVLDALRPVIVNGITDFITRPDLLDRSISLELAPIPDSMRRTEKTIWENFNALHPRLLGAVLDLVSAVLRNISQTQIREHPRMADFIEWVSAAEPAMGWTPGTLLSDYNENNSRGGAVVLESSSVAQALLRYLSYLFQHGNVTWRGSASALYAVLRPLASADDNEFPSTTHHLSGELRRLSSTLRKQGVHLHFGERVGHNRDRILRIQFAEFGADADLQGNSDDNDEVKGETRTVLEKSLDSASASDREPESTGRETFEL